MNKHTFFIQKKLFNFIVYLKFWQLKREAGYSDSKKEAIQKKKIKKIVKAAMKHELYREKFKAAGLDPSKVSTKEELDQLPPLTKEEYRNMMHNALENDTEGYYKHCHRGRTSGSTGMPLHTCLSPAEHATVVAQLLYILDANGYRVFRDASMDIRSPSQEGANATSIFQKFGLLRKYYVSTMSDPEDVINEINRLKPDELKAGKSIMYSLLHYADEHQKYIYPVKYIVSSAEPMDEVTRGLVNKFFGPNALIDIYATIESGLIAFTMCGDPYKFCLNPSHYLYTIRNRDGQISNNGELLITNLYLKNFPMINYKQGDSVETFEDNGKTYLATVQGRSNDFILTSDGDHISILQLFPVIAAAYKHIEQYRFIQEEYDKIKLVLVKNNTTKYSEQQIEQEILQAANRFLGNRLEFTFEWLERIPVDANDKIRVLICNIKEDK